LKEKQAFAGTKSRHIRQRLYLACAEEKRQKSATDSENYTRLHDGGRGVEKMADLTALCFGLH
jgi:hypothetical protein